MRTAVVWGAVITAGLAVRSEHAAAWPDLVTKAAGDALWTTGVFLALRFLLVRVPSASPALAAFTVAGAVEVSQPYRADWIERLRGTWLGAGLRRAA